MKDWHKERQKRLTAMASAGASSGMPEANSDMIDRVIGGMGPDSTSASSEGGAHAVANMACDHAPKFCDPEPGKKAYQNAYDLKQVKPVGATRHRVDGAVAPLANAQPEDLYFLAIEINGTGVRFYGDLCLVLKKDEELNNTTILNGNSYDLVRPPQSMKTDTKLGLDAAAADFRGIWDRDLAAMATLKVFDTRRSERRLTTGQISDAVLDDEDYLEVLKVGTFDAGDLHEVRISAASAAEETAISERMRVGPTPPAASLLWRKRRRDAVASLNRAGVKVRTVSHTGRLKG